VRTLPLLLRVPSASKDAFPLALNCYQPLRTAGFTVLCALLAAPADAQTVAANQQPSGHTAASPERLPEPREVASVTPTTLDEFQAFATSNHPAVGKAAARVEAARGRWVQAGLYPNPSVGYVGEEIGNENSAGMHGAMVSQELVRGGKLQLSRVVACREIEQARQQFEAERRRVLNDVTIEFYTVLTAQRAQELAADLLRLGEQGVESTEQLFNAQEASRVDLLQAKIEVESARVASEAAMFRHQAAWRRLAAAVSLPEMEPVKLEGDLLEDLPALEWQASLERVLASSPELAAARTGIARARARVRREQVEPIGNLSVQAGVMHDFHSRDDVVTVQAMVPLPWHNRNQGNIQEASAEVREAMAEVLRLELDVQKRLAAAFERYSNARYQVDRYSQSILPNAKKSLDLVTVGYRQGEFNFLTLLTAQRTYFQTNLAYLSAVRELRESTIVIEGLLITGEQSSGMPISQRIESRQSTDRM
jgi:cobalt-zinc-cadmium efflux system outer membrane protein